MRKLIAAALIATVGVAQMGAAAPAIAKEEKSDEAKGVKKVIPTPAEDKGQVVFYRPGGMGFALGCGVNENGERLSALGAGKYVVLPADPGSHSYTVKSEATDLLTLEVEPGETYYVKCKIKMGIMVGRPNIAPSTQADFDALSHKLEYVDADDIGPKKEKGASAP
ncbi:DUF2846 domain-containing protein [Sphingopyxis sp. J-6]|uniref:DUF2846 domain-containing protein n=1 Tax=Sphingopyxis sp. J-6 TaxID=3122054 RepID=UPI0039844269